MSSPDPAFWTDRTVLITGARGFLGAAVLDGLARRGVGVGADGSVGVGTGGSSTTVVTPTSTDCDLRRVDEVDALFAAHAPDVVIHLAARVGGIGANMARPSDLYLDNLLMGTYVIDAARRHGTDKTVVVGTICSYPKFTPVPFAESSLWQGYPEETNAPYGVAKLAQLTQLQANREQYGQNGVYLLPTNLYGPRDKFHPAVSHVIPALIKKTVEAAESGADYIDVWGTGSASREFLYVDDAAEGILLAAERYNDPDPVNLGADRELAIRDLVGIIVDLVGFTGEVRWDTSKPDGQPRRGVDGSRASERFGFVPATDFSVGLKSTLDWYLANRAAAEARAV